MKVETKYFAFELPDGFVARPDGEYWSAVHEADRREIVVAVLMAKEEGGIDAVLGSLAEKRVEALRANHGADHVLPVAYDDRGDLRLATLVAVGRNPMVSFCVNITHRDAVMGKRCVVMFCLYQYFDPTKGAPDVARFQDLGRSIVATLEPLPQRHALARGAAQGDTVDPTRLYPYLVPSGYLESRSPTAPTPRKIGHDLFVALAEDFDGAARIHYPEDLASLGAPEALVKIAASNLARAASERRVTIRSFAGPRGLPVMVFGPEWMAAGCLFLPDLASFAAQCVGEGPLCAAVPHRDALFVFRNEDAAYLEEMKQLIAKEEAGAPKPLTEGLFALTAEGPSAI